MTNTLGIILQTSNEGLDILEKTDSFYNNAFNKLLIVGTVAFGIIGIVIPLFVQWYQKRTLKQNEEFQKREIELLKSNIKAEVLAEVVKRMDEKSKEYESKMKRIFSMLHGKTHHLQGNNALRDKNFSSALSDFIIAAKDYLNSKDYQNLQRILNLITDQCLPNLSLEEIDGIKIDGNSDLDGLIKRIEDNNKDSVFSDIIIKIKRLVQNAPKTIKDKKPLST